MTNPTTPSLVARTAPFAEHVALSSPEGDFTYADLLAASARVAAALLDGRRDLNEARVCFHVRPGFEYVAVQWGIWRAGGIAVPLALSHPPPELEYVLRDAEPVVLVAHGEGTSVCATLAARLGIRLLSAAQALAAQPAAAVELPAIGTQRRALMVYTSGTTGRAKGVVSTHANLEAQIESLVEAWAWSADDRVLLVLPLHHVHGIVNVLGCALWCGATCEMPPEFNVDATWDAIASKRLTLFMAVPTIYRRLIAAYESYDSARQQIIRDGCSNVRLMVSGSAALPVQTLERWFGITGHVLLERYGMTEMGMALSNPLVGTRRPGFVGTPLPGVEVRLVGEDGSPVAAGEVGEIEVRGANVFHEYWRRPDATRDAFRDGWFRTGDTAIVEQGAYRLLGRSSVDILKTGGYKVSALEIEDCLRDHPAIAECAVVGVPDTEWGDAVSVAVELRPNATLALDALRVWAKDRLAPYKVPRALRTVASLPRNAMGKVIKPDVARLFAD